MAAFESVYRTFESCRPSLTLSGGISRSQPGRDPGVTETTTGRMIPPRFVLLAIMADSAARR